ncbi:hypothetical protein HanPSC8_Chr05g0193751 [Helianthus annuus]|nr:hypothetical protein HanPSC8_Chr05g0193751 [Helianthus annuus]
MFMPFDTLEENLVEISWNQRSLVVDHIILLHPSQPLLLCNIQLLRQPRVIAARRRCRATARRLPRSHNTSIRLEVSVGSSERSLTPVSLHKPTPGGPVVRIP